MAYTERKNINRGYMKLEVWNDAVELLGKVEKTLSEIQGLDFKLRSQILDSAQSISSNITEGYCRRSLKEYLHFLNIALGSSGELLTRLIGLKRIQKLTDEQFEQLDKFHYQVENKLLALIKALQAKAKEGTWDQTLHEPSSEYNPS